MSTIARILRPHQTGMTEEEHVAEFLEVIRPLGLHTETDEYDWSVYIHPNADSKREAVVWVDEEEYPVFKINGRNYYCQVFFHFIRDDKSHGPESMNSDMILAITAEYMKKYPDALFNYEGSDEENIFLDKKDIDEIILQSFVPDWFSGFRSHLHTAKLNGSSDDWTLV